MKPYYKDEACTIWHGDCREILPTLEKVDLVLTDPPYGLNRKMQGGTWGVAYSCSDMLKWDYVLSPAEMERILSIESKMIIWGANNYSMPPSRCWLVWLKPCLATLSDVELAWTNFDAPAKCFKNNRISKASGHPTEKPLELFKWCIEMSKTTDTILDPFMGSGTTLRAAKDLGRKAIGIELEEKYCEIAARRLEQGVLNLGI